MSRLYGNTAFSQEANHFAGREARQVSQGGTVTTYFVAGHVDGQWTDEVRSGSSAIAHVIALLDANRKAERLSFVVNPIRAEVLQ